MTNSIAPSTDRFGICEIKIILLLFQWHMYTKLVMNSYFIDDSMVFSCDNKNLGSSGAV